MDKNNKSIGNYGTRRKKMTNPGQGLPDLICINTSIDFEIGVELEIPSGGSNEESNGQERRPRRYRMPTVASWLTENVVGLNSGNLESHGQATPPQNAVAHGAPSTSQSQPSARAISSAHQYGTDRRVKRFERDTRDLRVQVLVMAMRRKMQSLFQERQ